MKWEKLYQSLSCWEVSGLRGLPTQNRICPLAAIKGWPRPCSTSACNSTSKAAPAAKTQAGKRPRLTGGAVIVMDAGPSLVAIPLLAEKACQNPPRRSLKCKAINSHPLYRWDPSYRHEQRHGYFRRG